MTKPILIIDPGHGGIDPGGGSNKFWKEKDMVLDISLYQFERFKELGVPVQLTRATDTYLSPSERTRIVRESGAKYCISNHINAGGGDGAETIYSIYADDDLAVALAEEIAKEGQNIRRVFTRTLPYNQKKDYYFMHRDTGAVETVIVEYGFADSTKDDVEQLKNHWKDYAEAVVRAFCRHINHPYCPPAKDEVSEWAKEAHKWVVENGISDGMRPKDGVTREEFWTMLYRYDQKFPRSGELKS